jgi:hypothetical protein
MDDNELAPFFIQENSLDMLFTPTPQDWGLPAKPTVAQQQCWDHQELFLKAYARCDRISEAAKAVGITPWAVERWQRLDLYGIRKRMELAHREYVEAWEQAMDARLENPTGNRGSDVLMMFKMKAIAPEKYREEVKVVGSDPAMALLDKLKALERDWQRKQALERGEVVEGEVRELPGGEGK